MKISNKIKVKNADGTFEDVQISYIGPNGTWSEGDSTTASGKASHVEGYKTIASGDFQHVQGQYNIEDNENKYAHIIGNGTSDSERSNAFTVDWDGNGWFAGNLYLDEFKVLTEEDLNDLDLPEAGALEGIYDEIKDLKGFETAIEELQELNTNREVEIDGIESDIDRIKEQIENKADENHNHDGDYDSAGAAADAYESATNYTNTKVSAITYSSIGAAASSHTHDDRYFTESEINTKLGSYLPLSGGTITGATYFNASPFTKANLFYNSYDTSSGGAVCLIGTVSGNIQIGSNTSGQSSSNKNVVIAPSHVLRPANDSSQELGTKEKRWSTIYSKNALNIPSDFNLKENIEEIPQKYIDMLDDISPVIFKFKQGDRLHGGYISQWVEEAMNKHGITAEEFGGFCKDQKVDENQNPIEGEYQYSLRYAEFIPILHAKIKQLEKEIYELKNK